MPEFLPSEADDRVFPELYDAEARKRETDKRRALFRELEALRIEPVAVDERYRRLAALRGRMRDAGIHWPYGYSAPVEAAGYCLECSRDDGSHARDCGAVS